jgi:hypothetical protein
MGHEKRTGVKDTTKGGIAARGMEVRFIRIENSGKTGDS